MQKHTELQLGQIIRGRRVTFNRGRVAALLMCAMAATFAVRGISTTTSAPGEVHPVADTSVGCTCNQTKGGGKGIKTGGAGGGGTIHIGG